MSEDLESEKLIVIVRKREIEFDEAISPGCTPSLLKKDLRALEKSRLRNAYKIGFTNATAKRIKSNAISASWGSDFISVKKIRKPVT